MTNWLDVQGLEDLRALSHTFKGLAETGMRRELNTSLNSETKQTRKEMRAAILPALPKGGGLADDVLRSTRFTTSISLGREPGVRIRARGKRSIRRMNRTGTFRHPVFGRRDIWVTQLIGNLGRFLDRPFEASRPQLQRAIFLAISRVRSQINRSLS